MGGVHRVFFFFERTLENNSVVRFFVSRALQIGMMVIGESEEGDSETSVDDEDGNVTSSSALLILFWMNISFYVLLIVVNMIPHGKFLIDSLKVRRPPRTFFSVPSFHSFLCFFCACVCRRQCVCVRVCRRLCACLLLSSACACVFRGLYVCCCHLRVRVFVCMY